MIVHGDHNAWEPGVLLGELIKASDNSESGQHLPESYIVILKYEKN